MFERFTDDARLVVVRAQDEARELRHPAIGTEHILLGLLGNDGTPAARALASLGLDLPIVRGDVIALVGRGKASPVGHLEFTPRATKIVELALREALQLGGTWIAPEHLLLAIGAEGQGVAMRVLRERSIDRRALWDALVDAGGVPPSVSGSRRASEAGDDLASTDARDDVPYGTRRVLPTPPPPPFLDEVEEVEEEEIEETDEPLDSPICPRCEAPLDGTLRVRALTANVGAGGRIVVPIAYCGRCGAALEAIVRVTPDTPMD